MVVIKSTDQVAHSTSDDQPVASAEANENDEYPYPLDVIVRNIQNVVVNREGDSSDEDDAAREVNHALKLQGFKVVEKENGADCEFLSYDPENAAQAKDVDGDERTVGQQTMKARFKKGHRRAWSMPNAHHRDKAVLIVAENNFRQEGPNRRHLVRYRLHPYTANTENEAAITQFIETSRFDPEDDEIEVTYDEEEITNITAGQNPPRFLRARRIWESKYKVQDFHLLPSWLQDNEFLHTGHRPPLPSFTSCFQSIFQIHTETGNIWTHLYGCVAFIGVAIFFLTRPNEMIYWKDKLVFSFFFVGAIACLGLSFSFHLVQCHSQGVGKLFSKLDYSGITMLIVGSFLPFIYYGFYCRTLLMLIYVTMITVLGFAALVVSLWDKFAEPKFRPVRAIVFVAMGLSSIVPCAHLLITDGFDHMIKYDSLHWITLMGVFYLTGAAIYAFRFPERCCPGRFDIVCHSHQLFHLFVVLAAFIHFHGITEMAMKRLEQGSCSEQLIARYGTDQPADFFDKNLRSTVF
ncbi:hypothetical protein M3Y94_00257300 [Aphelenchoides besseyi]|nr:hypothetical protein M3Y94_00257300 [Aphelenchoides besseyi]KAI6236209.1 hypothetical protein M3Y95_00133300 [Aphelenchoides besseyi]